MKVEELVKLIKTKAPTIEVKCAPLGMGGKYWLVEGDVPLREDQLLVYAAERVELAARLQARPGEKKRGLVAIEVAGKLLRWWPGKILDYCVWRPSFSSQSEYDQVVKDMQRATDDWSALCGVRFEHRKELDTKEDLTLGEVLFPVIREKGGDTTIAMAFFPNSPVNERAVWIFDGYFGASPAFAPVGVLRHELGHVLGCRHEHIRPEAPDYFQPEPTDHTVNLTEYDPQSVMHYVGPGVGNPKLEFTELDRTAAIRMYGHPYSDFTFQVD